MITDQQVDEILAEVTAELKAESYDDCHCPENAHEAIDQYWVRLSRGALTGLKGCADCGACCNPEDDGSQVRGGVAVRARSK